MNEFTTHAKHCPHCRTAAWPACPKAYAIIFGQYERGEISIPASDFKSVSSDGMLVELKTQTQTGAGVNS